MDKKELRDNILSQKYDRAAWCETLKDIFAVNTLYQVPQSIHLSANDIAIQAVELGRLYTADEREVGIYEVTLKDEAKTKIPVNKVGLRNLLRSIYKYEVDAALIVFVHKDKWRFSYVSEIKTLEGKKETEPKRYTYVFGIGESCRTAADRFFSLKDKSYYLQDLFEAFSVEKLNKDFFKSYKGFFEKFSAYLADQPACHKAFLKSDKPINGWKSEEAKPIRDFVKKLLGRLVFLQFLQKKGWIGVPAKVKDWTGGDTKFLQNLFSKQTNSDNFHSEILRLLFFETLNIKRKNDIADLKLGKDIKIPYLNGGLFDSDISVKHKIDFPAHFFGDLLDFFENYNFTIDENDPDESEVGIDPEMLGHIFENLLEENREKGAFYTPKEIVYYMCQESLIQYLNTELPDENKEDIDLLVRYHRITEGFAKSKKANLINDKLKAVKICDPAIGSGAFPMGLLKIIFECRRVLYGYINTKDDFKQAEVKKEIIQNNIYGVDLENGAVEIARLRFWLALVVDELMPQPLPNLDYKIMQGNSLLERFANIDLQSLINSSDDVIVEPTQLHLGNDFAPERPIQLIVFSKADKEQLHALIEKYFDPDVWEKKTGEKFEKAPIKKQINDIVEDRIHAHILKQQRKLKSEIDFIESKWKNAGIDLKKLRESSKEYKQYGLWKKQLADLDYVEAELIKLQLTDDKPYFLWHLWFKDVFDQGGFDIVIGNPPYIQLQKKSKDTDDFEAAEYQTFARTGDIYCLFYEQGNKLLKPRGNLCYITSNKWMNAAYGKNFRKYLLKDTNPILLIDFSKAVIFPAAVVFVNILQFKKEINQNTLLGVRAQNDFQIGKTPLSEYVVQNAINLVDLNEDNWTVAEKRDFEITMRIDEIGIPIKDWDLKFFRGVTTGLNEVFHITEDIKKKLTTEDEKSAELIHSLLRGKDIKRYKYDYKNISIIFTKQGTDIEKYPAIKRYLSPFKHELTPKKEITDTVGRKPGSYMWFEIQDNTAYYKEFEKEKIIWIEISDRANYCIDTAGHYLTNSAYFITGDNLKFLLAVLNSRLMDFYFYQKTAQIAGGRKRYTKQYVELLPIPQIGKDKMKPFELIIEYLIFLNDVNNSPVNPFADNVSISPIFEDVLNMMVYELYFEQHMKDEEIDVWQFISEDIFVPLSKNTEKDKDLIGRVYKKLQEQDNPIRNRIILSNIKSKNIIRRINSTTH